jgi:hypothetical protein
LASFLEQAPIDRTSRVNARAIFMLIAEFDCV